MATPLAVPLAKSSNFDCSQVRVPSANIRLEKRKREVSRTKSFRAQIGKFGPRKAKFQRKNQGITGELVPSTAYPVPGGHCSNSLLNVDGQHLRARHNVIQRSRSRLAHRRFA